MQVRKILKEFDLKPKKKWGQNFLFSKYYLKKIEEVIELKNTDIVVEVGAGIGNLTALIFGKVRKIIAIEKDKDLFNILKHIFKIDGRIQLINEDFLKINLSSLYKSEKKLFKIVGNPPYYFSSELIKKLIQEKKYYEIAFLSLQEEYLRRILALPNTKAYGRLTIFAQVYLEIKSLFKIPRNAFYPAPKVDSIFISVKPRKNFNVKDGEMLSIITREFFQKRRKKIRTIIKASEILKKTKVEKILNILNLDLNRRPQELTPLEYVKISNLLRQE